MLELKLIEKSLCKRWEGKLHFIFLECLIYFSACPEKPHVFTKKEGNFSSPGGGTGYNNNTCTRWFVQAPLSARVMIIFHGFDLEPSKTCQPYDFVLMQEQCNITAQWYVYHCHVTPLLYEVHWLPVRQRINFKILLFVFKAIHRVALFFKGALVG